MISNKRKINGITLMVIIASQMTVVADANTNSNSNSNSNSNLTKGLVAGGSITAGTATYSITSYASTIGQTNDLIISDGVSGDLAYQSGWLYRIAGDSMENIWPEPDAEMFGVNEVLLTWNDVDARGLFSAAMLIEIAQPVSQSAVITKTLVLTNLTAGSFQIDLFSYEDIDVSGSFGNDAASLFSTNYIKVVDGLDNAEFRAGGANKYQVTPFSTLRTLLINGSVNNLNNTGLPMAANDFTGAFQWTTQTVPVYADYTLQTKTSFHTAAPAPIPALIFADFIYANGFE